MFLTLLTLAAHAPDALAADEWTPTAEQEAVYRALSVRDPAPDCAAVEALSATPVTDLLMVVEQASMPPWAPMRAADCLVTRHAEEIPYQLAVWVSQEETRGLAYLTLNRLDDLPEDLALSLAQAALEGPLAEGAKTRIARAETPAIQALVAMPAP